MQEGIVFLFWNITEKKERPSFGGRQRVLMKVVAESRGTNVPPSRALSHQVFTQQNERIGEGSLRRNENVIIESDD